LSAAWATLTALVIAVLPETWVPAEVAPRTPVLFFVFVLAGYTFACLQAGYTAAREGQTVIVAWPCWDLARAARGGVEGIVCFLAGPVVLEGVALIFWLGSGDLQAVDGLIRGGRSWGGSCACCAGWGSSGITPRRSGCAASRRPTSCARRGQRQRSKRKRVRAR